MPNFKLFEDKKGIFQQLQSLEFLSLIGSGAAAIARGKSIFCNGANLAYRKSIFLELNAFDNNTVSGDDVFLMHHIKQKYAGGIAFASPELEVTGDETQVNSFPLHQELDEDWLEWQSKIVISP